MFHSPVEQLISVWGIFIVKLLQWFDFIGVNIIHMCWVEEVTYGKWREQERFQQEVNKQDSNE